MQFSPIQSVRQIVIGGSLLMFLLAASVASAIILPYPTCDVFDDPSAPACLDNTDPPPCDDCSDTSDTGNGGCTTCGNEMRGMPIWWVSEPFINLRLEDEPLGYQPPRGKRVGFHLSYRQRGNPAQNPAIFGVGPNWSTSLRAYVIDFSSYQLDGRNVVRLHRGGASWVEYVNGIQSRDRSVISAVVGGGFKIEYPNGATDLYQKSFLLEQFDAAFTCYFLTASVDSEGVTNEFHYATNSAAVLLQSIVDAEGHSTTLRYENSAFPGQITRVDDPFGRSSFLKYDATGYLTNIVDAAGLETSFQYSANTQIASGWMTNMTTPYGTTAFRHGGENSGESGLYNAEDSVVDRFIDITEPNGSHQLYAYRNICTTLNETNSAPFMPSSYSGVPSTAPFTNMFDNAAQDSRNSFHWNRMQYSGLSSEYLASGSWRSLSLGDYKIARLRHWLTDAGGYVSPVLSLERAPSPDGIADGQLTWNDYEGKPNNSSMGTNTTPLFVARVLPDGATWFKRAPHNARGKVTSQVDTYTAPTGAVALRTNTFIYADNGIDLIAQYGPTGRQVVSNNFNAFHQPTATYNALNEQTLYRYDDATHLVTNLVHPSGLTTTCTYDGATRQLIRTVDEPIHRTNSYTYYTNGLVLTQTDPRGMTITKAWDNLQRLVRIDYPDGTSVSNSYTRLDLTATRNRLGDWTRYAYNAVRQKIFETNANNGVTAYGYCDCGALMYRTNALGTSVQEITRFSYDYQGNRIYAFLPEGDVITNWFDPLGRTIITADGSGARYLFYNNQGQVSRVSNDLGTERQTTYDIEEHAILVTDANGVTVTNTYDPLGRILTRSYPDAGVEAFGYASNILSHTSHTNPVMSVTLFGYDEDGRKISEINPGVSTNRVAYSAAGDVLSLTDGRNQSTSWDYDVFGRVTRELDATSTEVLRYSYDPSGRMTNRWSLGKGDTAYSYDPLGNLTAIRQSQLSVDFSYDPNNRLSTMLDPSGTTAYTYAPGGRVQSEDGPWDDDTVSYTYTNRLRATMAFNSQSTSFGYDAARRLTTVVSPAGAFVYHYSQDSSSPLTREITLPNGSAITNIYDNLAQLTSTALLNSQQAVLNAHTYACNQASQRTNQMRVSAMGGPNSTWTPATNAVAYAYDSIGRLTGAHGQDADGAASRLLEQFGYAYDPAGNLTCRTNNGLLQRFYVNPLNELTNVSRSGTLTVSGTTTAIATNVTVNSAAASLYRDATFAKDGFALAEGDNTFTAIAQDSYGRRDTNTVTVNLPSSVNYQYDANGNLASDGLRAFDYDGLDQLIRVTLTNQCKSEFVYDGKKRRRIRNEFTWQNGAWTHTDEVHYIYDGNLVIQERWFNPQLSTSAPQRIITYTRGKDLAGSFDGAGGIDGLLARSEYTPTNSKVSTSYYHTDGQGNVTCLIDRNQLIVARYLYDPFGNILSQSGSLSEANLYRFSTKEFHPQSGLVYYLYRCYDPNLQRWLTRDPRGFSDVLKQSRNPASAFSSGARAEPVSLSDANLYGFVENDPLNRVDAYGLISIVRIPNVPFFFACPTITCYEII